MVENFFLMLYHSAASEVLPIMKTAGSIAKQKERKHPRDNGNEGLVSPATTRLSGKKSGRGDASRIAQWKPGQIGNATGASHDLASQVARAVFENNAEALYRAFSMAAHRGNAYAFNELADRVFWKLKERVEHEVHPYHDLTDEQIVERIRDLKKRLGWRGYDPESPTIRPNYTCAPN